MGADNPTEAYGIGSEIWPGLAKVIEEAGEVIQVAGKIMSSNGEQYYWNGKDLKKHLEEEIADLTASIAFLGQTNDLKPDIERYNMKLRKFHFWHKKYAVKEK